MRRTEILRASTCGVVEVADERLVSVRLRRFARRPSWLEVVGWGRHVHHWRDGDRCWLYYRQPRQCPQYLVLDYVLSTQGTKLATFRGSLVLLDEIARIKGSDALLCDVASTRISDRLLARWGWEPHAPSRWHRNYIKRFYGIYPTDDPFLAQLLASQSRPAEANGQTAGLVAACQR
jgi:hypothetical protein